MVPPFPGQRRRFRWLAGWWLAAAAWAACLVNPAVMPGLSTGPVWLVAGTICHAGGAPDSDRKAPSHTPRCPLCPLCQALAHAGLLPPPPSVPTHPALVALRLAMPPPARAPPVRPSGTAYPRGPPTPV